VQEIYLIRHGSIEIAPNLSEKKDGADQAMASVREPASIDKIKTDSLSRRGIEETNKAATFLETLFNVRKMDRENIIKRPSSGRHDKKKHKK